LAKAVPNQKSAISNTNMKSTELTAEESTNEFDGNGFAPLLRLTGVTKVFLTDEVETHALSGIHLDIREGEYVSIAGPSGCGKTTLLSILGLLDTPSDGSYALKGTRSRIFRSRSARAFVIAKSVSSSKVLI
jgi:ABC-type antimicrobial peptide transport system, ATPase component